MGRYFGFAKETTYNPSSPPAISRWIDIASEGLAPDDSSIYPDNVGQRDPYFALQGPFKYAGDISCWAQPTTVMQLLAYGLGTVSSSAADGNGVYTHTISPNDIIPSFTGVVGLNTVKEREFKGGAVNSVTLDYRAGEAIAVSFNVVGASESLQDIDTPTFPDERPFGFADATPTSPPGIDTIVEALSLTIANNIADDAHSIGSRFMPALIVGRRQITGSMDLRFETTTEYQRFLNGTTTSLGVNSTYGSAATLRQLELNLKKVKYDTTKANIDRLERIIQGIDFTAQYDTTSGKVMDIVVKNTEAGGTFF
tara:strand:- start:678 stop:1610 length:933 start_codon:yes stop_codon:yes gene_type:complete